MFCRQCGAQALGKFCGSCGAAVDRALPLQVPEPVLQPVRETFFPPSPSKPATPMTTWIHQGRVQVAVGAVAIIGLLAVLIAFGGGTTSQVSPSPPQPIETPSAVMTTEPTLKAALADANTCVQTLNRLADEVGPPNHDGSGVMLTDQQDAAAVAILGPQGERFSPLQELWLDAYTASVEIKYGGGYSADYQCGPRGFLVSTAARLPN